MPLPRRADRLLRPRAAIPSGVGGLRSARPLGDRRSLLNGAGVARQMCLGAGGPGELAGPGQSPFAEVRPSGFVVEEGGEVASDAVAVRLGVGDRVSAYLRQRQPMGR